MNKNYITKGTVFNDLDFTKSEISSIKIKAMIYQRILDIIERKKLKSRDLEKLLDQPQPRISELKNGRISKVSIEKLLDYLDKLDSSLKVDIKFRRVS